MPQFKPTQDDIQRRRIRERAKARKLGMSHHSRAMHESYEDLGYFFFLMLLKIGECFLTNVEKKTGIFNMYNSQQKANKAKPFISPKLDYKPTHKSKLRPSTRPHK